MAQQGCVDDVQQLTFVFKVNYGCKQLQNSWRKFVVLFLLVLPQSYRLMRLTQFIFKKKSKNFLTYILNINRARFLLNNTNISLAYICQSKYLRCLGLVVSQRGLDQTKFFKKIVVKIKNDEYMSSNFVTGLIEKYQYYTCTGQYEIRQ